MKSVKPLNKLVIGTVQFGCSYGVSNKTGKVSIDSAKEILACAKDAEIDVLDTAIAYGDSELCLGQIGIENWKVVSKLSELPSGVDNIQKWAKDSLQGSLSRLKIPKLYGLLLHRPQQLLSVQGKEIYKSLNLLKTEGLVNKIGISIYKIGRAHV